MSHLGLSDSSLIAQDIAPVTGASNVNGSAVDMQGWDGCQFVYNIGAMVNGATFLAYIVSSANANMSGATNVTNAVLTSITNASNTNIAIIDLYRPTNRYVQSCAVPATANVTFGSTVVRYRRTGVLPPTQSAVQIVKVAAN